MIFNSPEFIIFLIIVFCVYWFLTHRAQNIFLLIASYVFYGWWDWRFLLLIAGSSIFDFLVGKYLEKPNMTTKKRRGLLVASIIVNLGILGFFKYFGFFVESFNELLYNFGYIGDALSHNLNIILPVGISFYTFQSMSYVIDVYRKHLVPEKNMLKFMTYVAFFPQLVAGPIERAKNLLPQFSIKRSFDYTLAVDGARQMLWGFFKKIVIADNLAIIVNNAYGNVYGASGSELIIATIFFAFQIYCDFSGYSDIAIGCARLFGFSLTRNFAYPYFSRSIPEFWRRWHISLSTWFRDYVFVPLGGSRVASKGRYVFNIMVTFLLSGFWHGANWTYLIWGGIHGLAYIPSMIKNKWSAPSESVKTIRTSIPQFSDLWKIILTFLVVLLTWVFFRSTNVLEAFYVLGKIFDSIFTFNLEFLYPKRFSLIAVLIVVEWIQRKYDHPLVLTGMPRWLRVTIYYAIIISIIFFGVFAYTPFIYFQF